MEQHTKQILPDDLAKAFIDKADSLSSDFSQKIRFLNEDCERKIERFKKDEESKLEYDKKIAREKSNNEFAKNVDAYLQEFLTIIAPLEHKTRFSKSEDELLINVLNAYKKIYGYFLGLETKNSKIVERKLTIIYELNINRWTKKFGSRKRIEKTVSVFFHSISNYQTPIFATLGTSKSLKKVEENYEAILYAEVSKFRKKDKALNDSFIWLANAINEKKRIIEEGKYEEAGKLRDKEKTFKQNVYEKLRELFERSIADIDILSVINKHIG